MIRLDRDHLDQVERDIRPPMAAAITIPVTENDREIAIIYVCVSPFNRGISDEKLAEIAGAISVEDKMSTPKCPGCKTPGQPHHEECESDEAILNDIDEALRQLIRERPGLLIRAGIPAKELEALAESEPG